MTTTADVRADLAAHGAVTYVQLHHAGNRAPAAVIGSQPVCPSDDPSTGARALSTEEVEQVQCEEGGIAVKHDE